MKRKGLLCAAFLGAVMLFCGIVHAEEQVSQQDNQQSYIFQTGDGVLSIEAPDLKWNVISDPNYWFVLSDGGNTITIDHMANGEALPAVAVAGGETEAVYQAFVSTKNEVFVIRGSAVKQEDLEDIMKMISTIRVLKYDTKTAIRQDTAAGVNFAVRPINRTYYCISDYLNVRLGCSTDDTAIGYLTYGEAVTVLGAVTVDGEDIGWYQVSYNGSDAYVSAHYLSPEEPGSSTEENNAGTSASDEYFLVYGEDGISAAIHSTGGAMYEDDYGHTYSAKGDGIYYCIETDSYYSVDRDTWDYDDNVNVEGDPYGDLDTGSGGESGEYFLVYGEDGISVAIHYAGGAVYEDDYGHTYYNMGDGMYCCNETDRYYSVDRDTWEYDDNVNVEG